MVQWQSLCIIHIIHRASGSTLSTTGEGEFSPITTMQALAIHSGVYHHTPQCISGSPPPQCYLLRETIPT